MSTLEKMQCGEFPPIPNGQVSAEQKPYQEGQFARILCDEGFRAQLSRLRCQKGEWSSDERALNEICIRTSSVDHTNTTVHC